MSGAALLLIQALWLRWLRECILRSNTPPR
jgi:hypothetical protein